MQSGQQEDATSGQKERWTKQQKVDELWKRVDKKQKGWIRDGKSRYQDERRAKYGQKVDKKETKVGTMCQWIVGKT